MNDIPSELTRRLNFMETFVPLRTDLEQNVPLFVGMLRIDLDVTYTVFFCLELVVLVFSCAAEAGEVSAAVFRSPWYS